VRLTDEQIELYSRQIILREVGGTGQTALRAARVRVVGSGAAVQTCTSYLVGAGIGSVVVDAAASSPEDALLPLPAPGRRTPDASVVELGTAPPDGIADDRCDVLVDLRENDAANTPARRGPRGALPRPRLGSILLDAGDDGWLRLLLLPHDTGCSDCASVSEAFSPVAGPAPGHIALASAGALAALTCCRWLLGIGDDRAPRTLANSPGSAVWTDGAPPARVACPRGCPPPAPPV
jgi:molybdopterin-synthase adenylyltransferase